MSKQVLDIQQMQHLKELGVDTSKASMYWVRLVRLPNVKNKEKEVLIDWFLDLQKEHMHVGYDEYECLPTFTLQDILDLLPNVITAEPLIHTFSLFIDYQHKEIHYACVHKGGYTNLNPVFSIQDNLIDASYEMLCWCVENGYVETNKP